MGYYTKHSLEIVPESGEAFSAAEENSGYGDSIFKGEGYKWYEHESCMRITSKEFPDHLFILRGEGEESGDIWIEYYKYGKTQKEKAVIVFGEFDEAKLL